MFFTEFASLLETLIISPGQLLITGDFNVHVDDENNTNAAAFIELLNTANLQQHVTMHTHMGLHTLDLIITEQSNNHCVEHIC